MTISSFKETLLDKPTGEAAVKWWDEHIRNNPGLLVGCSLLEAFSAGFKAGRAHALSELFKLTTEPSPLDRDC